MRDEVKRLRAELAKARHEAAQLRAEVECLRAERRVMEATVESEHWLRMVAEDRANERGKDGRD